MNILKKIKNYFISEKKSNYYDSIFGDQSSLVSNLSITKALLYYNIVSPISTGIDYIADELQTINPQIYNIKNKNYDNENPLLQLLKNPNSDQTWSEFMSAYYHFFAITGNSYIIAIGDINKPPIELIVLSPSSITPIFSKSDTYIEKYIYTSNSRSIEFTRKITKGRFRYVNDAGGWELWHIRDFSTDQNAILGTSRLQGIYLEIEQFISSNKHNLSILKKGVRTSGLLTSETPLTADQRNRIKDELSREHAGADNAGRIFFADGGKFNFKEMSQSLKDMDFRELLNDKQKTIYNRLKIPLSLIATDQKYDNIFQDKLRFYDNTIIPLIGKLYRELSLFLFDRFKINKEENTLWFNLFDIEILRERELVNAERISKMNILTKNELRNRLNYEGIDGGDILYQEMNLLPLGMAESTINQALDNSTSKELVKLDIYKKELNKIKYSNGENVFSIEDK